MPTGNMAWVDGPLPYVFVAMVLFVVAVLYMIARGKLVPAVTVERREADWAERLAEQSRIATERLAESREREQLWRVAHGESEANNRALSALVEKLTVQGEATLALLRALPKRDQT